LTTQTDWEFEVQQLAACVTEIDNQIRGTKENLGRGSDGFSSTREAEQEKRRRWEEELAKLKDARPKPYFGRVDYVPSDCAAPTERCYLGRLHVPVSWVFNWRAPIGMLWYHPEPSKACSISAPGGERSLSLDLKRQFQIENAQLIAYQDLFRRVTGVAPTEAGRDLMLTSALEKPKGVELGDIVETIQADQYDRIASARDQVMIIQGAAGSGKSEIGLHRIAYLAYPERQDSDRIQPENALIIGPTRAFLSYVSNLLPGLDVHRVRQHTIAAWLVEELPKGSRPALETDRLLNKYLTGREETVQREVKLAHIKGSLAFGRVIERHMAAMRRQVVDSVVSPGEGIPLPLRKSQLKQLISTHLGKSPLNAARKAVLTRIALEVWGVSPDKVPPVPWSRVENWVKGFWPEPTLRQAYVRLLNDETTLRAASNGLLAEDEVSILVDSKTGNGRALDHDDLAALCSLNRLLTAYPLTSLEHIMIDEAHDCSPLQVLLLVGQSRNKSFSVLGDLAQRLLPGRGIDSWLEMKQAVKGCKVGFHRVRVSYRATAEITGLSNRVLKRFDPKMPKVIRFPRHGRKPGFVRATNRNAMLQNILDTVTGALEKGEGSIGVLARTPKESYWVSTYLRGHGAENVLMKDQELPKGTRVIVAPIHAVKGFQFDTIVICSANDTNFSASDFNNRLLYLAVTRASQNLVIHWYGKLASILAVPKGLVRTQAIKKLGRKQKVLASD